MKRGATRVMPAPAPPAGALRLARALAVALALLAARNVACAATADDALAIEGRALFHGHGARTIAAEAGGASGVLTLEDLPCAGCHGGNGAGGNEAGLAVPDIRAAALRGRTGADAATLQAALARVLTGHLRLDGAPLSPRMPRFAFTPRETAALVAYLTRLGEREPAEAGVDAHAVRFAFVPPHDPDLAAALRAAVLARLARENRVGGVFGRRLELIESGAADAGSLFALLAPWAGEAQEAVLAAARAHVPVVGAFGLTAAPARDAFVLMPIPDLATQMETLAAAVADAGAAALVVSRRIAAIQGWDGERALGLRLHRIDDGDEALRAWLDSAQVREAVLLVAPAQWAQAVRHASPALTRLDFIGVPHALLAQSPPLPQGLPARMLVAYPGPLPADDRLEAMRRDLEHTGAALRRPGLQYAAYASTDLAIAALRAVGRDLSREAFRRALLEQLPRADGRNVSLARMTGPDGRLEPARARHTINATGGQP